MNSVAEKTEKCKRSEVQDAAREYADRGWASVPLLADTKKPHDRGWPDKAYSPGNFGENSNIGIKLGSRSNGLVDADLDWPEARDLWTAQDCAFGRKSAPGGHRLFRCPEITKVYKYTLPSDCSEDSRFTKQSDDDHPLCVVELRGNGQTMFPPSVHPSGELIEWKNRGDPPEKTAADLFGNAGRVAFLSVVARCYPEQGTRDDTCMALAGVLVRTGMDADQADDVIQGIAKYCGDDEWRKRGKAGQTARELKNGEPVTGLPRLVEMLGLPKSCVATFAKWLNVDAEEAPEPLATLEDMSVADMLKTAPPARRWLLKDLLPLGVVGVLAAGGGTGKSMLTIQLAVAVATGRSFLGIEIGEPGPVLILAAEDERDEFHRRLAAVLNQLREDGEFKSAEEGLVLKNLRVLPRVAMDNRLTYQADGVVRGTGRAQAIAATANLVTEPKLVILDPVGRFRGGEENSNEHATRFVEEAEKIREATGATVLMPHHVSKAGLSAGSEGLSVEGVRGASALLDGARWAMAMGTLRKDEAHKFGVDRDRAGMYVRVDTVKSNYAAPWPGLWLMRLPGGVLACSNLKQEDPKQKKRDRDADVLGAVQDLLREKQAAEQSMTRTALRPYCGKDGRLGAGDQTVRRVVEEAIDSGDLFEEVRGNGKELFAPPADY